MNVTFRGQPNWPNGTEIPKAKCVYRDAAGNDYVELTTGEKLSVNARLDKNNNTVNIADVRWTIHPEPS